MVRKEITEFTWLPDGNGQIVYTRATLNRDVEVYSTHPLGVVMCYILSMWVMLLQQMVACTDVCFPSRVCAGTDGVGCSSVYPKGS